MDPRKLKVPELKEQLQLAGLSTAGKKEDLVARLLDHQKTDDGDLTNPSATNGGPPTGTGDGFDWDDAKFNVDDLAPPSDPVAPSATTVTSAPLTAPPSTTTTEQTTTAPTSTPRAETVPSNSATTTSTTVTTTPSAAGSAQFQGAPATKDAETLKAEHEKRKNRAARFGIPLKEQDKAVERAARFGVPVTAKATASLAKATGASTTSSPSKTAPASKSLPSKPAAVGSIQIPADVLSKRQERFGTVSSKPASTTTATTTTTTATVTPATSVSKTPYVLGAAEEEKKRKRAAKFGMAPSAEEASKKAKV